MRRFVVSNGGGQIGLVCRRVKRARSTMFCITIFATTTEAKDPVAVPRNDSNKVDVRQRFSKSIMSSVGSGSSSVDCRIAVSVHCGVD